MSLVALCFAAAVAQDAAAPAELRPYSTIHSLGFEWDLEGDANRNASCAVRYRAQGAAAWKIALPLFRVDFHGWYADTKADRRYNMLAGSILFLEPGTAYEVQLDLSDADGGSASKTVALRTRAVPAPPRDGRTLYVVPGSGGGDGSPDTPFRGLTPAAAAARPGDVFLLGAGEYGPFTCDKSGEPGRHVVWKGRGDAILPSLDLAASHVWFEGLTFKKQARDRCVRVTGAAVDVVMRRNTFLGYQYSIFLSRSSENWYIADNVIEGDEDPVKGDLSGEGIELNHSSGHVVCYNRISRVADGVSYPHRNCDIYGNDIFDVSDDGLEPDYGYANNRMWGNRLTNCKHAGLSFQPMYCGPWYFLRNQVVGAGQIFKFRVQDRFVLANNTFVTWGHAAPYMHHLLTSLSRNNLYIRAGNREGRGEDPLWIAIHYKGEDKYVLPPDYVPGWKTDVDYDGFDWGKVSKPFTWENGRRQFADVAALSEALGIEKHGIRVRREEIFESFDVPDRPARLEPGLLTLKAGSNAVDAGAPLPNLVEEFAGKAPDLGAHELGGPAARYGPRDEPGKVDVWVAKTEGYHSFRIPSVIVTSKNTVLAFCEARKKNRSDWGDIDLVLRRSTDGGATWSPTQMVWDDGPNTCGNPCPVIDRNTGTIWLLLTHNLGVDPQAKIVDGTSQGSRTAWVCRSEDDGLTWSKPVEITKDVKKPDWSWYATGPGVGIQTRAGRFVIPCDHSPAGTKEESSHVFYSDDAGKSWRLGGKTALKFGESQVVELADGTLMLNMRNHESPKRERGVSLSKDGGLTWSEPVHDATLVEPVCQASILRYTLRDKQDKNRLLFSNPVGKGRNNLTVRMTYDEGKTWPVGKLLHAGPAAYSCLTVLQDLSIGCLYEGGEKEAYDRIIFAHFSLDWLTDGKDKIERK